MLATKFEPIVFICRKQAEISYPTGTTKRISKSNRLLGALKTTILSTEPTAGGPSSTRTLTPVLAAHPITASPHKSDVAELICTTSDIYELSNNGIVVPVKMFVEKEHVLVSRGPVGFGHECSSTPRRDDRDDSYMPGTSPDMLMSVLNMKVCANSL
ncbi:hypothetical protein RB195_009244 [Necator americanus]|uniref:Uncharacterized protein n=1 Tax=Necator americanus TaxID=51031 RepID=A0ABR1CSH6_NECAM